MVLAVAGVVIPLTDFSRVSLPATPLAPRGGTSFAAAFEVMRQTIESDAAALKARGAQMFRPVVFFLTDGQPNPGDPWEAAFDRLTRYDPETKQGFRPHPVFVPFGLGDAKEATLRKLVHPTGRSKLFMAGAGTDPAKAIEVMTDAMMQSVLSSGRSASIGAPQVILPPKSDVGAGVDVIDDVVN